ncbi:MAG: hypothetical protein QM708_16465 [Propioniciclava sp.]|uniref:hypothetical protein n=1 Tax=Propioniciclava sp. TaxID=2038686 RepID=UPI0039E4E736
MRWRVVRAEATSGVMLAGGAATFVVALVLSVIGENAPLWPDRTRVATVICIYTVPVLMAVSAIVSGRRMEGLSALSSASTAGERHPALLVGLAGSLWAGLIGLAQCLVPIALIRPDDLLPPTALLSWVQALASLVAGVWVGASFGIRFRGRLAGPVLGVIAFAGFYSSMYFEGRFRLAAPFDSPWYVPWTQPAPGAPVGHSLVAVALILGASALFATTPVRRRVLTALAAVLVPAGILLIGSVAEAERYELRPIPEGPVCEPVGGGSTFCAHPLGGQTRVATVEALRQVRAFIVDLWEVPQNLVHHDYPARPGDHVVPMSYGADASAHVSNAAWGLRPRCADSEIGLASQDNVYRWMTGRVGSATTAADDPLADVFALGDADQRAWVREQLRAGSCR